MKKVVLLWHGDEPVGICVFSSPIGSVRQRSRYFGLNGKANSDTLAALTGQLWVLSRVVLHPTYRGAGVAAGFIRRACALCPVNWIEAMAAMGRANPFFEKAGFVRVGMVKGKKCEPVYYVLDNRSRIANYPQIAPMTQMT